MGQTATRAELRHRARFRRNRSNRGRDMAIFQDGGRRHLGFLKFRIFNGQNGQKGQTAFIMPNFVEIAQTAAEIWQFFDFQDGGRRYLGFEKF